MKEHGFTEVIRDVLKQHFGKNAEGIANQKGWMAGIGLSAGQIIDRSSFTESYMILTFSLDFGI